MKPLQKPDLQALFFPPRLIAQLKQIRHYPLTVLEAPSGFGKTTALDHLLKTPSFSGCRIFRRTVAEAGQPALWDTFCKMLSRLDALCTDALRQKGIPEPETLDDLTETLQEIECTEETYLILDHVNVAEDIGLFLHVFSRHQNPKLHILLLAQQLPEKTSGQFLMNHQILYLNASDFTFTEADTSLYLNAAGIQLLPGEAQKLYQMTGGWIFAMYLALLCYTRNGRFEPGILNHLIETAFFSKLHRSAGELCNRRAGRAGKKSAEFTGLYLPGRKRLPFSLTVFCLSVRCTFRTSKGGAKPSVRKRRRLGKRAWKPIRSAPALPKGTCL